MDDSDSLETWLARARAHAAEQGDTTEIYPGVLQAEAEAAAAHAVVVQHGYSTPAIEGQRLYADRRTCHDHA